MTGNFSPVSGDLKSYGNYPWKADPLNEPWKIVDPASGYKFPTNDFGAYYASGLDAHGNFDPTLADRSLLVNTLYPDKGPTWGVDDGYGWVDPATNNRYTFIAYYAHWFAWYSGTANINSALSNLQSAYIYTGDEKYAKAGAVLLDRIADVYPSMDVAEFSNAVYVNSHGGTGDGKVVGSIWETSLVKVFTGAYDAFFTAFDAPDVVSFLQAKGQQYDLPLKQNGSQIRRNIEDGILRQVAPGMYWDQIRGNNGFHQSAAALAAVVHDTLPETQQWLDFVFQPGAFVNSIPRRVTGGNVLFSMVNDVDRDGHGNEAGPGYNRLWIGNYLTVADALDGYDKYPSADLYEN
ncbi:MAG: bacterial Ig-like protein, partial [Paenibacillus sp.]|nr:bacterial Ig-like protein [Paenibacillus sp.]